MSNSNVRNQVKVAVDLLNSFKNDHPHKDVKIILDDGEIEASKFVLAARSEYFKKMFNDAHRFKESQENAVTIPYKRIVMNKVIEYLYGGELNIDGLAMVEVFQYLDLLRMMMLDDAFETIETKLIDHFDSYPPLDYLPAMEFAMFHEIDDAHYFQIMAIIFKEPTIKATIMNHPEEIRKLPKSIVLIILDEVYPHSIVRKNVTYSTTEIDKFRFFKIWIDSDDRNEDVKWARKIAQDKFVLRDFKVEELLGEVKKSKLFNDTDIENAVIEVSRIMEKQLHNYRVHAENIDKILRNSLRN